MPWVKMQRKASQWVWRAFLTGGLRVPAETAEVEVTARSERSQALEARVLLRLATRAGVVGKKAVSGAVHRLPLTLTRGCASCRTRHGEGGCDGGG